MSRTQYVRLWCPHCADLVTDEECPHWDYENDPRRPLDPATLARWAAEVRAEDARWAAKVPAWYAND